MKRYLFLPLILIFFCLNSAHAQKGSGRFKIAFYNTENLFDTIDDPNKSDEEFLPSSKVAWTAERYHHKLNNIARVIISIDSVNLPEIVGFAEVENLAVLNDLVSLTALKKGGYQAILEEGSDPRGIDVGLIFRKNVMTYAGHRSFPSALSFRTRSVLYVRLTDARQDTFHLFVNHWKSRSGGAAGTEQQRIENADMLKHLTDSLIAVNPKVNIVIMGDFNDEPSDKSLSEALGALKPGKKAASGGLYNLMYDRFLQGEGTLYYKDWDLFDQFVVSGNLLNKKQGKGAVILPPYAYIFKPDWLLYKNRAGVMVPNRTAGSNDYFGGYSDHLPVYLIINH